VEIPEHIVTESPERFRSPNHPSSLSLEQPLKETTSVEPPSARESKMSKAATPRSPHVIELTSPISCKSPLQEGAAPESATSSPFKDKSPGLSLSMLSKVSMKAGAAGSLHWHLPLSPQSDLIFSAKMKPALLAEWDLSHVLAQLNQVKQVTHGHDHAGAAVNDSKRRSVFKDNPDPANINEYHLGIAEEPPPTHLEFQCGQFCVSNEGTALRSAGHSLAKDSPKTRLPDQWWCSSETAVAAIKKVARQELEEKFQKDRGRQDEPKGLSSSSVAAGKKKPTLAAGTMTLGNSRRDGQNNISRLLAPL
jgi:hypothetical protein